MRRLPSRFLSLTHRMNRLGKHKCKISWKRALIFEFLRRERLIKQKRIDSDWLRRIVQLDKWRDFDGPCSK